MTVQARAEDDSSIPDKGTFVRTLLFRYGMVASIACSTVAPLSLPELSPALPLLLRRGEARGGADPSAEWRAGEMPREMAERKERQKSGDAGGKAR